MSEYRHTDTKLVDGLHVEWARIITPDDDNSPPDQRDEGFWPSMDPDAPGYVDPAQFAHEHRKAMARFAAHAAGEWEYVGVQAEARCLIVRNGHGTYYTLRSPGVWGMESDCEDYINGIYGEQKAELLADIAAMAVPAATGVGLYSNEAEG